MCTLSSSWSHMEHNRWVWALSACDVWKWSRCFPSPMFSLLTTGNEWKITASEYCIPTSSSNTVTKLLCVAVFSFPPQLVSPTLPYASMMCAMSVILGIDCRVFSPHYWEWMEYNSQWVLHPHIFQRHCDVVVVMCCCFPLPLTSGRIECGKKQGTHIFCTAIDTFPRTVVCSTVPFVLRMKGKLVEM